MTIAQCISDAPSGRTSPSHRSKRALNAGARFKETPGQHTSERSSQLPMRSSVLTYLPQDVSVYGQAAYQRY